MASDRAFRAFRLVSEHLGLGLITRRSRVQIPPPLLQALVSDLLTRASTVQERSLPGFYRFFDRLYQGLYPTFDLRVS